MFAPRSVSDELKEVSLTGMLVPWKASQPVLLSMPMSDAFYLPAFDSEEGLRSLMGQAAVPFDNIKVIEDGAEFLASIPDHSPEGAPLKIILNPRFTERGTVRFTEIRK